MRIAGPLVGTHAHEVMSITAQLMGRYDDEAGDERGPVPIAALLAHLLYLRHGLRCNWLAPYIVVCTQFAFQSDSHFVCKVCVIASEGLTLHKICF